MSENWLGCSCLFVAHLSRQKQTLDVWMYKVYYKIQNKSIQEKKSWKTSELKTIYLMKKNIHGKLTNEYGKSE